MRLRLLNIFVEVVRRGSFSQAGLAVHASQSAVSKAIAQLEDTLGVVLLERSGKPLRLTAAGELVHRHAVAMLAEQKCLRQALDELQGVRRGELRLGLPPLGSAALFAPLFAVYRQRYPAVDIQLVEHGSRRLEELLLAGKIELAASLLPVPPTLSWQAVCREPLMAVLPVDHPLAGQTAIGLDDLRDTPFILFEQGFALNGVILKACARHAFEPLVAARSGQVDFISALVAAGQGVAFLPRLLTRRQPHPQVRDIALREPDTDWQLGLVWQQGSTLSPAAQAWLSLTREKFPQMVQDTQGTQGTLGA